MLDFVPEGASWPVSIRHGDTLCCLVWQPDVGTGLDGTVRLPLGSTASGDRRHELTVADFRKGDVARWAAERERRAELEQRAVELLADELLRPIDVWIEMMRDAEAPAPARLQAADRIMERILTGSVKGCWFRRRNVVR